MYVCAECRRRDRSRSQRFSSDLSQIHLDSGAQTVQSNKHDPLAYRVCELGTSAQSRHSRPDEMLGRSELLGRVLFDGVGLQVQHSEPKPEIAETYIGYLIQYGKGAEPRGSRS